MMTEAVNCKEYDNERGTTLASALMRVIAEMRRTGSAELNHWADRIQDAVEESCED